MARLRCRPASPASARLDARSVAAAAVLALVACPYAAAEVGTDPARHEPVVPPSLHVDDATRVVAVELQPAVTLESGAPARGLGAGDFVVLDDGEPAAVTTFSDEATPLAVALLVDRSVSMGSRLETVLASAARFVEALGPADRVAVFGFDQHLTLVAPWQATGPEVVAALGLVRPGGTTSLHDALAGALRALQPAPGRRLLVLLSDGRDVRSSLRFDEVLALARSAEIAIHAISTGGEAGGRRDDLELLAAETGGRFVEALGRRELDRALRGVLEEARSRYALTFAPASLRPGVHRIEVLVRGGELDVRHRRSFVIASR